MLDCEMNAEGSYDCSCSDGGVVGTDCTKCKQQTAYRIDVLHSVWHYYTLVVQKRAMFPSFGIGPGHASPVDFDDYTDVY